MLAAIRAAAASVVPTAPVAAQASDAMAVSPADALVCPSFMPNAPVRISGQPGDSLLDRVDGRCELATASLCSRGINLQGKRMRIGPSISNSGGGRGGWTRHGT